MSLSLELFSIMIINKVDQPVTSFGEGELVQGL